MKRIIVFTGKGGVGKSSVAAAHARKSAKEGAKTILLSTDAAHNLGDIFERKIGREIVNIAENLDAIELNPQYIMETEYQDLMRALKNMLASEGMGNYRDDKAVMMPGMEELFSLLKILDLYESGGYERIIVDCAPTGETLSLLKFPELLKWYIDKFFPIGKMAVRVLSPFSKRLFKIELPDNRAMTDIERLYVKLISITELLKDREVTTVRIVALPEKMVVEETKRNYMYLSLYGFPVDGVFINRVLSPDMGNAFFSDWLRLQKHYIEELQSVFADIPIITIPWYETDLCGIRAIDRLCEEALTQKDLFAVRYDRVNEAYEKTDTGYMLKVFMPVAQKGDIQMYQSKTDLIIRIGNFKRNIPLPNMLREYEVTGAKLEDETLRITFEQKEREEEE